MIRRLYASSRQTSAGFTLLEMLVVIIMAGIMAAIAAPGWIAFMDRQRLNRANDQSLQALRTAQAEAKRTGNYRAVVFDTAADPPRFAVVPITTTYIAGNPISTLAAPSAAQVGNWETIGQGNIKAGSIKLSDNNTDGDAVIFGPKGDIVDRGRGKGVVAAPQNPTLPFRVDVELQKSAASKRCVKVETLLGAVSSAEGTACQ